MKLKELFYIIIYNYQKVQKLKDKNKIRIKLFKIWIIINGLNQKKKDQKNKQMKKQNYKNI